jgi:endonuclease/exonuclease/phosphatase family metal-dependent hydrolase
VHLQHPQGLLAVQGPHDDPRAAQAPAPRLDPTSSSCRKCRACTNGHAERHHDWPEEPQHDFLAEGVWPDTAYGGNAIYDHGHHGNAILSRFPILASHNQDISELRFERRGMLHTEIAVPGLASRCTASACTSAVTAAARRRQMSALAERMEEVSPGDTPLIVAGDFNDWHNRADNLIAERLGMVEVFGGAAAVRRAASRPALPVFRLDRIYVRGFAIERAEVHFGGPGRRSPTTPRCRPTSPSSKRRA